MERRDFLRYSTLSGIGLAIMPSLLQSCQKDDDFTVNFDGKVLIIGAGAAGMMAAYTCHQYGVDFELIEAGPTFGGRVKKLEGFVDFPVDMGAEWLHDAPKTLGELINDENAKGSVEMISYQPESIANWDGTTLTNMNVGSQFYREYKFKSTTWYDFFEDFIVPSISSKLILNEAVSSINYSASQVVVTSSNGTQFTGDKVIVTVPVPILQKELITFTPALPSSTIETINGISFPAGIKVFIRFSEKFYPDMCGVNSVVPWEKIYFDGAFKKDTNDYLLTLFYVAESASELTDLTDTEIFTNVMNELDDMFENKASQLYVSHTIMNWVNEPFIQGSYSHSGSGAVSPVDNLLYFAGEAFTDGASSTVHGAGFSGRDAARTILQGN